MRRSLYRPSGRRAQGAEILRICCGTELARHSCGKMRVSTALQIVALGSLPALAQGQLLPSAGPAAIRGIAAPRSFLPVIELTRRGIHPSIDAIVAEGLEVVD